MACLDFNEFKQFILQFDQAVEIDLQKDKPLRYNVWETTQEHVADITSSGKTPDTDIAPRIKRKLNSAENRIRQSNKNGGTTQADIFNHKFNIEMSIALHELMESVKGESDKARNLGIDVSQISDSGVLPSLPMSRVAASIGRKIAFQKGYRFKRALNDDTAARIEALYYDLGREALVQLETQGYVKAGKGIPTIMDYQNKEDLKKDFPKNELTRSDVLSIALNEKKLGIGTDSTESAYFLNRTEADLTDTDLGVITEKLRMVAQITQPQTVVLPDTSPGLSDVELAQWDDGIKAPDPKTGEARKAIYEKPLFVNKAVHGFLQLMNEESLRTGKSATQRINEVFGTRKNMVNSLFGLKRSDDFSIDKKESIAGQNLSKTTPLDDLVEYYDLLQVDGNPSPLHLAMKIGRNARLYYLNSVLNPHASKQSRYMLTPGEYTVDLGSADFKYLVYQISENLKVKGKGQVPTKKPTYKEILGGTELDSAIAAYDKFQAATTVTKKMQALGPLAKQFQGIDYVTLLTSIQAIKDVRNAKDGKVTTEFTVSADATASGGTLTFLQALGTNKNVTSFLERINMLTGANIADPLKDLYGLMSNAIEDFVSGEGDGLGADIGEIDVTGILKDTLDLLFNEGKDIREFSKDPTMVFVYGQGRKSATDTIARSLADRIIDNLDEPQTRKYLSILFDDKTYTTQESAALKDTKGLYKDIVDRLKTTQLPQQMFDIMQEEIRQEYLNEYLDRSEAVYALIKKLPADVLFRILPAGAVLDGKTATLANLKQFGMPITKTVEVLNKFQGKDDTVLTRKEKLQKTVMDVSTTHGQDAGVLYHTVDDVKPEKGIVVIHDQVNGTVQDVRAMEDGYAKTARKLASEYDVHQQIMNAIAAYSPEIAASSEFLTLKESIDANVAEKKQIISASFNDNTNALIGEGTAFEEFANPETAETVVSEETINVSDQTASEAAGRDETINVSEERTDSAVSTDQAEGSTLRVDSDEDSAKPKSARTPSDEKALEDNFFGAGNLGIDDTSFDSGIIYTQETAEERAAKVKKDSRIISKFLSKVVPESPLLAHFIKNTKVLTGDVFNLSEDQLKETNLVVLFESLFGEGGDSYNPAFDTILISGKGLPKFPIPEGVEPELPSLDLDNKKDLEEQVLIIEHEITHAYTVPYIEKVLVNRKGTKKELANMDYLDNAIIKLEQVYRKGKMASLPARSIARVEYILNQPSLALAMSEFVAIMTAETAEANDIYKALSGSIPEKTLRARIAAVLASIKESFMALTRREIDSEIDADALQQALLNTFIMGKSMREQKADEFSHYREKAFANAVIAQAKAARKMILKHIEETKGPAAAREAKEAFDQEDVIKNIRKTNPEMADRMQASLEAQFGALGVNSPFIKSGLNKPSKRASGPSNRASFDYLNYAVATMINSKLEREGKKILGNLHNILSDRFPMYTDASNKLLGIYDSSPALQQFLHTVTGENVDKVKKANVLAKFAEINAQRTEIINDQVSQLTALSKDLKDSEKADLDVFTSQMPLHDFFVANVAGDLSTAESIEAKAELLRKELWKINNRAVREVDSLVDWNIGIWNKKTGKLEQKVTNNMYNLSTKYPPGEEYPTADFQVKLRQLLALESINRYGAKKLENLMKNEELFNVIKDNSMANVLATLDNAGTENVRDSLVMDYYKEPFEIKAVHKRDFRMYEFGENTGWKILKSPTTTELGIVYKPTIDSTDIAGAYTDMKMSSTDVDVGEGFKRFPGVVETRNGHKLLLTKDQKRELGLIEDFSQGLVRSTAHSMAMQESQIIRDELLKEETHMTVGKGKSIDKLESIIEAENIDNPWFIKLDEGTEYSKLPAAVRAKYMPVGSRASNVKGFNDNVDLVRKDISHWLLGGSSKSLFENPKMRWAVRILKNLVSGAKIGMVVLNPVKIANDNLSNLTYLGVLGVSPTFIASNYKEISTDFAEYSDLQRQIFQTKLQLVARPDSVKVKKHLKSLQKRLAASSIGDIGDKGFVNSLGSDLVSRSADTLSGFQADMHKSLEYLLTNKDGNKNVVSHFIMQMQKIGYQAEDFFGYLGDIASRSKSTALLHQELDMVSDRLREIKSEEDIVNYVAQFTTSPSSETVRFGSAMTDLTDVLAKETLYRHLTQNKGMSPSDARISVLDSFPDYKENMPIAIKALSDVGIIMFPSFWLRIQKIIYRMARDKPVGLATELMVQEMLGTNVNTIFEANVINKSQQFGGIFHTPFEPIGVNSVVPTNLF